MWTINNQHVANTCLLVVTCICHETSYSALCAHFVLLCHAHLWTFVLIRTLHSMVDIFTKIVKPFRGQGTKFLHRAKFQYHFLPLSTYTCTKNILSDIGSMNACPYTFIIDFCKHSIGHKMNWLTTCPILVTGGKSKCTLSNNMNLSS